MHTHTAHHTDSHTLGFDFHPLKWLVRAFATRHQRSRLNQLDDHMLDDIGVGRDRAEAEAKRPFWDLP